MNNKDYILTESAQALFNCMVDNQLSTLNIEYTANISAMKSHFRMEYAGFKGNNLADEFHIPSVLIQNFLKENSVMPDNALVSGELKLNIDETGFRTFDFNHSIKSARRLKIKL